MPAFVGITRPRGREPAYNPDQVPDVIVRGFKILKSDVNKHGPTPGCKGCRAVVACLDQKRHRSTDCRERLRRLLAESDEGVRRLEDTETRLTRAAVQQSERLQPGIGGYQDSGDRYPELPRAPRTPVSVDRPAMPSEDVITEASHG